MDPRPVHPRSLNPVYYPARRAAHSVRTEYPAGHKHPSISVLSGTSEARSSTGSSSVPVQGS
eukprot:2437915-Rhodomonas_salina.2